MQLKAHNLSKAYGDGAGRTRVLDELTLDIPAGDFVAVVGTSGSGKTTLLNLLAGLDRDFEGRIEAGEHNLGELSDRELSRLRNQHFGFVFQHFSLLDHLTAVENVKLPSHFGKEADTDPDQRARELLARVGLEGRGDDRPPTLSGGQKQRVAIARALFCRPSVIFCDEPTGSLDQKTGLETMQLLAELNDRHGATLLVVTHEEHIAQMAERIVRLEDGRIRADEHHEPAAPDELRLAEIGDEAADDDADARQTPAAGGPS
ncbi:MAG: ABC transporter ATP-binding protein [Persicimonas sp.]